MEIFLDSSKVDEARKWMPVIAGATTNPTILLKDGSDVYEFAKVMRDKPVSVEACGDFLIEAREYAREIPNAIIKVPLLTPGGGMNLEVIEKLVQENIKVNCTALFSLSQVILAASLGVRYVSLFAGRVDDEGGGAYEMISDCMDYLLDSHPDTELIVGSIRTVGMVLDAARAGASIVTLPPAILEKMVMHHYSLDTVKQFEEDHGRFGR